MPSIPGQVVALNHRTGFPAQILQTRDPEIKGNHIQKIPILSYWKKRLTYHEKVLFTRGLVYLA